VEIEYKLKKNNGSAIGDLKFPRLLYDLGISKDRGEKLNIKINYFTPPKKPPTEIVVMSRFGMAQAIVTNTLEYLMAQKIRAIITRKDLQPRDFYDVVWFLSRNIKPDIRPDIRPDFSLLASLGIKNDKQLRDKLGDIYRKKVTPHLKNFKSRLKPFLIEEENISYLDIFGKLIAERFR
jgi:hypothetical protein